ncbi:aldo/keto reductase [Kibdelosporangium aridum]|uniref:Aldo/keto reductase n=1 Tax=Kibdelosporangium aridum TaxID=2030 RepID=A0A428ZU98_KIBAR|nr:aldo/keto reductase [Kibdelosporangium aridum]RSM91591.1 aldo/keto reductase [Kibdelosporangium aridum]
MTSRRTFLKAAGGAGAFMAAGPGTASAANRVLKRQIPSTGEWIPALGLGTFMTFDQWPSTARGNLREVLRLFWDAGGRVIDTSPLYGLAEANLGEFAKALGINRRMFATNKVWTTGRYLNDDSLAVAQRNRSLEVLGRDRLDVVQVHNVVAPEMHMPILRRWKADGKIRMLGITHHDPMYYPIIEHWIRTGDLDFVQIHYSIQTRIAEQGLLDLAADHGTAVMVNMPLEKARLHALVGNRPLPDVADDIGARTWAQFFLKYVLAHPAVTVVLAATTNPQHQQDNLGALTGRLPDRGQRQEMVRYMETIDGFAQLQSMRWYPGKTFNGQVRLS